MTVTNVQDVEEKLYLLGIEEDQLLEAIAQIHEQRRALLEAVSIVEARPVSINSLPPEVLLEVFKEACALDQDLNCSASGNHHPSTLHATNIALAQVCRTWRQLAIGNSTLWTTLDLGRPGDVHITLDRSASQKLDVIRTVCSPNKPASPIFPIAVAQSCFRWNSLSWNFQTSDEARWLLQLLYSQTVPSPLRSIHLGYEYRHSTDVLYKTSGSWKCSLARFPVLDVLAIENIHLAELHPTLSSPSLRVLSILLDDAEDDLTRGHLVSRLSSFLRPAQNLTQLSLMNSVPVWDICLAIGDEGSGRKTATNDLASQSNNADSPMLELQRLRMLEWTNAPSKDLHRLFHLLGCFNLEDLWLVLDAEKENWRTTTQSNWQTWCTRLPTRPFLLDHLKTLCISAVSSENLAQALRKLDCPNLQNLTVENTRRPLATHSSGRQQSDDESSNFPRSDSLFHDPRVMRNLKQLEIIGSKLDPVKLQSVMMYMISLESLIFEACKEVGAAVCLLFGAQKCYIHPDRPSTTIWTCPRLTALKFSLCNDLRFSCLSGAILARKTSVTPTTKNARRQLRPLPNRQKTRVKEETNNVPSTPPRGATTRDLDFNADFPSPNGSFVEGWSAHEPSRPVRIQVVQITSCRRIAKAELMSLQDEVYGVREVSYAA